MGDGNIQLLAGSSAPQPQPPLLSTHFSASQSFTGSLPTSLANSTSPLLRDGDGDVNGEGDGDEKAQRNGGKGLFVTICGAVGDQLVSVGILFTLLPVLVVTGIPYLATAELFSPDLRGSWPAPPVDRVTASVFPVFFFFVHFLTSVAVSRAFAHSRGSFASSLCVVGAALAGLGYATLFSAAPLRDKCVSLCAMSASCPLFYGGLLKAIDRQQPLEKIDDAAFDEAEKSLLKKKPLPKTQHSKTHNRKSPVRKSPFKLADRLTDRLRSVSRRWQLFVLKVCRPKWYCRRLALFSIQAPIVMGCLCASSSVIIRHMSVFASASDVFHFVVLASIGCSLLLLAVLDSLAPQESTAPVNGLGKRDAKTEMVADGDEGESTSILPHLYWRRRIRIPAWLETLSHQPTTTKNMITTASEKTNITGGPLLHAAREGDPHRRAHPHPRLKMRSISDSCDVSRTSASHRSVDESDDARSKAGKDLNAKSSVHDRRVDSAKKNSRLELPDLIVSTELTAGRSMTYGVVFSFGYLLLISLCLSQALEISERAFQVSLPFFFYYTVIVAPWTEALYISSTPSAGAESGAHTPTHSKPLARPQTLTHPLTYTNEHVQVEMRAERERMAKARTTGAYLTLRQIFVIWFLLVSTTIALIFLDPMPEEDETVDLEATSAQSARSTIVRYLYLVQRQIGKLFTVAASSVAATVILSLFPPLFFLLPRYHAVFYPKAVARTIPTVAVSLTALFAFILFAARASFLDPQPTLHTASSSLIQSQNHRDPQTARGSREGATLALLCFLFTLNPIYRKARAMTRRKPASDAGTDDKRLSILSVDWWRPLRAPSIVEEQSRLSVASPPSSFLVLNRPLDSRAEKSARKHRRVRAEL